MTYEEAVALLNHNPDAMWTVYLTHEVEEPFTQWLFTLRGNVMRGFLRPSTGIDKLVMF